MVSSTRVTIKFPPRLRLAARNYIQYAIVAADSLIERARLFVIRKVNDHINAVQHRLFLLSMAIDAKMLKGVGGDSDE